VHHLHRWKNILSAFCRLAIRMLQCSPRRRFGKVIMISLAVHEFCTVHVFVDYLFK